MVWRLKTWSTCAALWKAALKKTWDLIWMMKESSSWSTRMLGSPHPESSSGTGYRQLCPATLSKSKWLMLRLRHHAPANAWIFCRPTIWGVPCWSTVPSSLHFWQGRCTCPDLPGVAPWLHLLLAWTLQFWRKEGRQRIRLWALEIFSLICNSN